MPVYTHPTTKTRVLHRHIPRTSGISIARAFKIHGWHSELDKSLGIRGGELHYGEPDLRYVPRDYDFVVVRNPWYRLLSSFLYYNPLARSDSDSYYTELTAWFKQSIRQSSESEDLTGPNNNITAHLLSQSYYIGPETQIWYFEDIKTLHRYLLKQFGIQSVAVTNNRGRSYEYPDNYGIQDTEFSELYVKTYGPDHEKWGYDLPRGIL